MWCRIFHRRSWHLIYTNHWGGTKKCFKCGRKYHFGGLT